MSNIKISIIIPIYNSEFFLKRCISSIINQDLKDIEIICIDDSSTDNSLNILKKLQKKHKEIIILKNQNRRGAGISRNKGIDIARGEYIHFIDADDTLVQNIYNKIYSIAHNNNLDILRTKTYLYDYKSNKIYTNVYNSLYRIPKKYFNKSINFLEKPYLFFYGIQVAPWAGLFKTKFLKDHNIRFNTLTCVNDRSFFAETIFNATSIMFTDVFLIYYTINNNNSLVGKRGKFFNCHFKSYNFIEESSINISQNIRKKYLNSELYDAIYWSYMYSDSPYKKNIIISFNKFIDAYKQKDNHDKIMYYIMLANLYFIQKSKLIKNVFLFRTLFIILRHIHIKYF